MFDFKDNETAAKALFRLMLDHGKLPKVWGFSKVGRYRTEFPVNGGRIDLLLFHSDGGISIVETKGHGAPREIAGGIGQLHVYAVLLPQAMRRMPAPKYVNLVLAAAVAHEDPERALTIAKACESAHVRFLNLPTVKQMRDVIKQAAL